MRTIHRAVHFDFHTMPGIYDINRDFDAAVFAKRLADAHVDYINFFAHCNLGFAYFPSKVGMPYPGLRGDMFGDILRECHARGIGVTAYLNVGLMHEQMRLHPDWCRMDRDGRIYRDPEKNPNFFRTLCYNSEGYHDFLLALIREICAYDIDGLFCDCMHFFPCHCDKCTRDMLALGLDAKDEETARRFSRDVMYRVSEEIKEIVGPDRYLYLNGMPYYAFRKLHTHAEIECLPSNLSWGYDYFWPHAAYARNIQKTCLYMTGRFQRSWGDFGGYKGKTSLENDVYDALMNAFVPSVGDHMRPAANIEPKIYRDVGEIYARVMQYEKYTDGARYMADIGVLTDSDGYLGKEYAGLTRMLGELQLGFDIVHVDMDVSRFKLLILPDHLTVGADLAARLEEYLAHGGRILSTGFGGTCAGDASRFALREYRLDSLGADPSNASYFNFTTLPEGSVDMPWSMYVEGIRMLARDKADERARYVRPYFNRHWDGLHAYYYTPPEKETGEAAAAVTGAAAHICFNVFTAYNKAALREHKLLVRQLIDELLPDPLVKPLHGVPSTARLTLTGRDDYALLHVKVSYPEVRGDMGIIEDHATLRPGASVLVRGEYKTVCLLPGETPVEHCAEDGHTRITLPEITGYDMFLLK